MSPEAWARLGAIASLIGGLSVLPWAAVDRTGSLANQQRDRTAPSAVTVRVDMDSTWIAAPFRDDRRAPLPRFGATREDGGTTEVPAPPPPEWVLTGILDGASRLAVFEPAGGQRARVAAVGDTVDGFVLIALVGDSAVVGLGATRWSFPLTRPWRR